jgi:hypothetical protein
MKKVPVVNENNEPLIPTTNWRAACILSCQRWKEEEVWWNNKSWFEAW